jgi:Na+-transporting NADH:ubiquinone oxidoreductase subunit NqrB
MHLTAKARIFTSLDERLTDPRYLQILFLGSFLLYGIISLQWDADLLIFASIFISGILTQFIFQRVYRLKNKSMLSVFITCLGLSILLKTSEPAVAALAAFIAMASKFTIRFNGKHIFNPANIGIVATIFLTHKAWISPGQWGSQWVLLYFVGSAGLIVLLKAGRLDTGFIFLFTLFIMDWVYSCLYLGWEVDFLAHKYTNGAILLYSFFMITDPVTTPNATSMRIAWAMCIAMVTFVLQQFYYIQGAPFWVLFFMAPLIPFLDKLVPGKKFQWTK